MFFVFISILSLHSDSPVLKQYFTLLLYFEFQYKCNSSEHVLHVCPLLPCGNLNAKAIFLNVFNFPSSFYHHMINASDKVILLDMFYMYIFVPILQVYGESGEIQLDRFYMCIFKAISASAMVLSLFYMSIFTLSLHG